MEEKRSRALHEGNKKSGGQARKTSAPRSRREKEQIWLEHLKKTMSPAQYEAYVEREKKRRLMTGIGIGAGAVFFLLLAGSIGGRVVHSLKKPASAGTGAAVVQTETETGEVSIYAEADATLGSTGCVLLHSPFISSYPDAEGNYDFSSIFKYITSYYSAPDFMTCEFEGTLSGSDYSGYPNFKSPDAIVKNVQDSGVDLQMLATNHVYDGLSTSFHRTMEVYEENQIAYTGVRETAEDKPYYLADVNGIQVGFLDYVYETKGSGVDINGIPVSSDDVGLINTFDYDALDDFYAEADERIRDMKKEGARFIVVNLHWGTEYQLKESEQQREIAQKLCDLGVDALIGGHPHCLQPIDVFQSADGKKQMFCIFSVGNALSNQRTYLMDEMPTGYTEDGVMVTLSLHQNTNGTVDISGIDLLPTWVYRFQNNGSKYYILPLDDVDTLPEKTGITDLGDQPEDSYERTMDVLGEGLEKARAAFERR